LFCAIVLFAAGAVALLQALSSIACCCYGLIEAADIIATLSGLGFPFFLLLMTPSIYYRSYCILRRCI
jgi:hypothetical protein